MLVYHGEVSGQFMQQVFYSKPLILAQPTPGSIAIEASIQFNEGEFGVADGPVPFTIAIRADGIDVGRIVGFEGTGSKIISMHALKPDPHALRGFEITVYRMGQLLTAHKLDATVFAALEKWLLKRGWRGNIVKRLKYADASNVLPIRTFWLDQGFELFTWTNEWDEHVVKRWR